MPASQQPDSGGKSENSETEKEKKNIFRVIQDDLVSTKHKQNVKRKDHEETNKENVEIKSYHIQ